MADGTNVIAVVGATGLQGNAVTRRFLHEGWAVRALTRDPRKRKAQQLAEFGAELVRVDTAHLDGLVPAFDGVHGVYNVQNLHLSSYRGEVAQGRNVAEAAHRAGVAHVVHGSAGTGEPTGIGSWDAKLEVEAHMRQLDLPLTILRPLAFMELMTAKKFYPALSVWHTMPKLMGADRPVGWLAVDDLAVVAAKAFRDPARFVGQDLALCSDIRSIADVRRIWTEAAGRPPRRMALPTRVYERLAGTNETTMWRWLRDNHVDLDPGPTLAIHPNAMTVEQWLASRARPASPAAAA